MSKIFLETFIRAPIDRCFDLSRSVDLHIDSASQTNEKAISGVTSGLMGQDDVVTWSARHFGITQKLSTRITIYNRPKHFRDSQIQGIFSRFDHDHFFEVEGDGTLMKDVFDFDCPFGVFGTAVDFLVHYHLEKFLKSRNQTIKKVAESDEWKLFL